MPSRARFCAFFVAIVVAPSAVRAAVEPCRVPDRPSAAGSLAWISSDDLDLAGGLQVEIPFLVERYDRGAYVSIDTQTAIRRASGVTFEVRDLAYTVELGARRAFGDGLVLSGFATQWGKERADADGQPWIRFVGAGIESSGFRCAEVASPFAWQASAGVILDEHETDAAAVARAAARWTRTGERVSFGADLFAEALLGGSDASVDLAVGPRLDIPVAGGRAASFFLRYVRARTPFGLDTTGAMLGFSYAERPSRSGTRPGPPDIRGSLTAGAGESREAGRLNLRVLSPPIARGAAWIYGDFDVNVLTAKDTGELYYLYRVGVEAIRGGAVVGGGFYHRSNHRLAEPGSPITSIDVLEVGIETPGWSLPVPDPIVSRWGSLDARATLGVLLDTSFGESGRPHGSGGLRFRPPVRFGASSVFVLVEAEDGQVSRRLYAVGVTTSGGFEVRAEYRSDEQFYGSDPTALLVLATIAF